MVNGGGGVSVEVIVGMTRVWMDLNKKLKVLLKVKRFVVASVS